MSSAFSLSLLFRKENRKGTIWSLKFQVRVFLNSDTVFVSLPFAALSTLDNVFKSIKIQRDVMDLEQGNESDIRSGSSMTSQSTDFLIKHKHSWSGI